MGQLRGLRGSSGPSKSTYFSTDMSLTPSVNNVSGIKASMISILDMIYLEDEL
jgi:hypothetical protein